jgi:hypothetical protein
MLEEMAGAAFPASLSDRDSLLIGTGRRAASVEESAQLGKLATKLPLILG